MAPCKFLCIHLDPFHVHLNPFHNPSRVYKLVSILIGLNIAK